LLWVWTKTVDGLEGGKMPQGLLEVSGSIDLNQFWPTGESDADTVKLLLSAANAFRFRSHAGAPFKVTHAFEGATVKGKVSKPTIDKNGRITIRLQGIDAPELHYRPTAPTINHTKPTKAQRTRFNASDGNFRQFFGETATVSLHGFLFKAGAIPIGCVVRTQVDEPADVFDTFGRFIGDIFVTLGGKEQNVNHWLCSNGWAFPTFYSSMTNQEINDLAALAQQARKNKAGLWKKATSDLSKFNPTMVFRNHGTPNPAADSGPVFLPKLFRRRSTFGVAVSAQMFNGSFKNYSKTEPDDCFVTADFLSQGPHAALVHHLDEFVSTTSQFQPDAGGLVFRENASTVIGKNGKPAKW
jgi:endonuclease YncB( thermonuclease family)